LTLAAICKANGEKQQIDAGSQKEAWQKPGFNDILPFEFRTSV
jgi:hypothetical protein